MEGKELELEITRFSDKSSKKDLGLIDGVINQVNVIPFTEMEIHLKKLVKQYKPLKITRDNYKKEGKETEQKIRNLRYSIQNWRDETKSKIESFKKTEVDKAERLIELILPIEKKLKEEITTIDLEVKKEKESKIKQEEERIARIDKLIEEYNQSLLEMLASLITPELLPKYNERLDLLRTDIESGVFDDFKYKAERIEAMYLGRRSEIEEKIKAKEQSEKIAAETKLKEEQDKERKGKVFEFRKKQIEDLEFTEENGIFKHKSLVLVQEEELKEADEMQFFDIISRLKEEIKEKEESLKKEVEIGKTQLVNQYNNLVKEYKDLGGKTKKFTLAESEIPTFEKLNDLTSSIKSKIEENKQLKLQGVKVEIEPFVDEFKIMVENFKEKVSKSKFKNEASSNILNAMIKGVEEVLVIDLGV